MVIFDIIYSNYYDFKERKIVIGGVETYIKNLSDLISNLGYSVRICQIADKDDYYQLSNKVAIHAFSVTSRKKFKNLLERVVLTREERNHYFTIFATDTIIPNQKVENSVAIQHGVSWDQEANYSPIILKSFLKKSYQAYLLLKRINNVDDLICVDNNFICWHRTQLYERTINLIPIFNFAEVPENRYEKGDSQTIKILFARRFVQYRGTRLFADAIVNILSRNKNVQVTFAGEGPDEGYLRSVFKGNNNVRFTTYLPHESVKFHSEFDIAVVPTTGSEGTSLSLLEAMSAGCSVICTNVGGMTNIVIDKYNGILISPKVEELQSAIQLLIDDKTLREKIARNAHEIIKTSFSLNIWKEKWTSYISSKVKKFTCEDI